MDNTEKIIAMFNRDNRADGDYLDNEQYLVCGKCHTRKQCEIKVSGKAMKVSTPCQCLKEKLEAEEKEKERQDFMMKIKALRRDGITDPAYYQYRFESDDSKNPKFTNACKRYVQNWPEMKENNIGILFSGSVGTGKTFLACCIANALLDKLVSVSVTNFPRILNQLQGFDNENQAFIDGLKKYDLLVIDDLGVERSTQYAAEQIFNVIDTRARAGKPLIITTNLTVAEMQNAADMQHKRIYDRVLQMCPIQLNISGESRRTKNAVERSEIARQILRGETK